MDDLYDGALAHVQAASRGFGLGEPWQIGVYVLPFVLFAFVSYVLHGRAGPVGVRSFFAYLLPRRMWFHRSSWVDVQIFVAGRLLFPLVSSTGAVVTALVASRISHGLAVVAPSYGRLLQRDGWWDALAFTVAIALLYDLATWISHALHHRVAWLWEFHKVHHSAEVLTPLAAFRHHPVYEVVSKAIEVALVAPFLGLALFLLAGPMDALTVFGMNLVFAAFAVLGSGLRHSHMWLSFGPVLSRVFISPAQHQIHHSLDRRHWDRNYGEVFALWDWAFGTLYVPRQKEELTFGLGEPQAHTDLVRAWLGPFRTAVAALLPGSRAREGEA